MRFPARRRWQDAWRPGYSAGVDLTIVFGLGALILGAGLGLRDPWPPDEPRFALMARDMALSGQWLFPMRAGALYADKPPLFMWLIGVSYLLTGSLRIAFLLPGLLAGLGTLLLVYDLGRRLWDRQTGLAASLLLLATFQFTLYARSGQIDPVLTLWTTVALYGLLRHLLLGPDWRWYWLAWAAAGAGIITKGVGFLPLLLLVPWGYVKVRGWPSPALGGGAWKWAAGPACLILAVAAWLAPMLTAVQVLDAPGLEAYRNEILLAQTVDRYVGPGGHLQPAWYFLVEIIPIFWLPLSALLPWLAPGWISDLRRRDPAVLLLLGWVALVILFFTLSPAKRGVYLLPALPAVVLAAAPRLPGLANRRGVRMLAICLSAAATVLLGVALLHFRVLDPAAGARVVSEQGVVPWAPLYAMVLTFGLIIVATRVRRAVPGLACIIAAYWLIGGWWLFPVISPAVSGAHFMATVASVLDARHELGIVRFKEKFLLHAGRPVTQFGYRRPDLDQELADAAAWLAKSPHRRLLVGEPGWERCFEPVRSRFVASTSGRQWHLVPPQAATPACVARGDPGRAIEYVPGEASLARKNASID
ncbi:glycosyltransferase family 39 protein [soil metagenome]